MTPPDTEVAFRQESIHTVIACNFSEENRHPVSSSAALIAPSESFCMFYAVSNHAAKGRFFHCGKYQNSITDHILKTKSAVRKAKPSQLYNT